MCEQIKSIYLIGSLRNKEVPAVAARLRKEGHDVFASWFAAGEFADDAWKEYEKGRGLTFPEALKDFAAQHVYKFDKTHLDRCDIVILLLPAGKSGHLELGYSIGKGKKGYILLEQGDDPRWDVMYNFAEGVFYTIEDLIRELAKPANDLGNRNLLPNRRLVPVCAV